MRDRRFIEVHLEGLEQLSASIAYCLSESLSGQGAFAFIKKNGVIIDASQALVEIMPSDVINLLEECLDELGIGNRCMLTLEEGRVKVRSTDQEFIKELASKTEGSSPEINICPHCGYLTPYPELLREHMKVHYIL